MSEQYRLMVYFAIATIHFYRDDLVILDKKATIEEIVSANSKLIKRVNEEAQNLFNYELSHEQICRAFYSYLSDSQRVDKTEAARIEH